MKRINKFIYVLMLSVFSIYGIAQDQTKNENYTEQEKLNMNTIGKLLEGFGTGNTEQLDELVHDDFMNHHRPEGENDKKGFYEIVKTNHGMFSSFDELEFKMPHLFAKGDMVAMMDVINGKKNGKEYNHVDIHIFRMKDGKMIEHWNSFNLPHQRGILIKFMESTK